MTLKEAREVRGWTLNETAIRAGISRQGLQNLEEGKTPAAEVKLRTALKLMALYFPDVILTELLGFPEIPPAENDPLVLFELVPRDRFAWAHLIADSTSDFKIART